MKIISIATCLFVVFIFTGCLSPQPKQQLTTEQMQAQAEFKKQFMEKMFQNMNSGVTQTQSMNQQEPIVQKSYITNEELLKQFNSFPQNNIGVKFTKLKDGFTINNSSRYIDPEGEIKNFGYDWKNGNVTYLIQTAPNSYKIKYTKVLSGKEAIDIAEVSRIGKQYKITTITGKKITSSGLILTSTGFISLRNESAFVYNIGQELYTFYAPTGWHIARFQNGDVASTKYILLERTKETPSSSAQNSLFEFIEATKELASTVGLTKKEDYMLINLYDSSKNYLFDISLGDKDVARYSQCRQTSRYIAKCDSVDFSEALYKPNGLPNTGHYYWTILWYSTHDGVIAVTREKTQSTVYITDLITGKKVEAAFRLTGFPELFGEQDKNGKIKLTVGGGYFTDVVIEDASKFLKETIAVDFTKEIK